LFSLGIKSSKRSVVLAVSTVSALRMRPAGHSKRNQCMTQRTTTRSWCQLT
jgi:hypothetical protein